MPNIHPTLAKHQAILLVMSGKMGSGKDVLAPITMEKLGYYNAQHMYYADALKNEIDTIITNIRENNYNVDELAFMTETSTDQVSELLKILGPVDHTTHSRQRTQQMRAVLQYWGTGVRRSIDPDYWVKITLKEVVNTLNKGQSIYITDARFPNEIDSMSDIGAYTVRLEITEEIQQQRLYQRDGVLPTKEATQHASENMLDDYANFTLRFANHSTVENAVNVITAGYNAFTGQ